MQVYLCSSRGFSLLDRLWFSSLLLHENSACTATLTGSVVAHIQASSKASSLPRHHLKYCLTITKQEWSRIVQEEGSSGKRRAPWYVRTVSLIAQLGFCYRFPLSRQGNLHAVAAFRRSHLRQMLWVTVELWLSAAITLNSGFQLSSDTSARWKGEGRDHGWRAASLYVLCTIHPRKAS